MTKDNYQAIVARYGEEYIYRQLAEEAAELAQAALKLIRARRGETPVSPGAARMALIEEMADVQVMTDLLVMNGFSDMEIGLLLDAETEKDRRMVERLLGR